MRKRVDKWKKAAMIVAFAGFLSVPSLPVLAANPEEPAAASTEVGFEDPTLVEETEPDKNEPASDETVIESSTEVSSDSAQPEVKTEEVKEEVKEETKEESKKEEAKEESKKEEVKEETKEESKKEEVKEETKEESKKEEVKEETKEESKKEEVKEETKEESKKKEVKEAKADKKAEKKTDKKASDKSKAASDTAAEEIEDGWHYDYYSYKYRYYVNGSYLKNTVRTIDGTVYGFDSDGESTSIYSTYGWYVYDSGQYFIVLYNGEVVKKRSKDAGWLSATNSEGDTIKYYIMDREFVKSKVLKIGKNYYGFKYSGEMYSGESFSFSVWNDVKASYEYTYYRAKKSGALYVNSWYEEGGSRYYYGAGGKGASGITYVKGKYYLFAESGGYLKTNSSIQFGMDWYVSDDKGVASRIGSKNGWHTVNKNKYYIKKGDLVMNQVIRIKNAFYAFSSQGRMFDDESFSLSEYDSDGNYLGYYYYRAKNGGKLYVNSWYTHYTSYSVDKYYYGAKGKAETGISQIGSKTFYLDYNGRMVTDSTVEVEGRPYVVTKSGAIKQIKNNTITKVDGYKYYAINDKMLKNEVRKIGSAYYGFDWRGRMYDNESFSLSYYEDGAYVSRYYRAAPGGKLYRNKWYHKYYYNADGLAPNQGIKKIGKKSYYFPGNGGAAITNEYIEWDGKFYHANKKGVLSKVKKTGLYYEDPDRSRIVYLKNKKPIKNQWKKVGKFKYYFNSDGYAYVGSMYEIKDKYYYFRNDGTLYTNSWIGTSYYATKTGALATGTVKIGKKKYVFSDYGYKNSSTVLNKKSGNFAVSVDGSVAGKLKKNGWTKLKGITYYAKKGVPADGLTKVGKSYYYFSNGRMMTEYLAEAKYEDNSYRYYIFKSNGKRVESGWVFMDNQWYYVDKKSHMTLTRGKHKIGKKNYYIGYGGAALYEDTVDTENLRLYTIGKKGVIKKSKKLANGWTLFAGNYYYYKNGKPYTGWVGKSFVVDGVMRRNTKTPDGYYVGNDGKIKATAGWLKSVDSEGISSNTGMYVKKGGKLATEEWLTINGKRYYFGEYSYYSTGATKIKGIWYIFSDEGALLKKMGKDPKDGWIKVGGQFYYFKNGAPAYGFENIGTKTYYFIGGCMQKNCFNGYYYGSMYLTKSGAAATKYTGWKKINGSWFYFLKNGKAQTGWVTVKGYRYYIDSLSGMTVGYRPIDGTLYQFNKKGRLTKIINKKVGWLRAGGSYYYFREGRLVTDLYSIKGKTYLFDYDGRLVENGYSNGYYSNKKGVIIRNKWKKVYGEWKYFGADGQEYRGVHKIGKKIYYFRSNPYNYYY